MDLRKQAFKVPQSLPKPPPQAAGGSLEPDPDSARGTHSTGDATPSNHAAAAAAAAAEVEEASTSSGLWRQYWDQSLDLEIPDRGRFRVYVAGSQGPVVFCLHGAGYTGLTWSLMAAHLKDQYRVVAPDLRCHGATSTSNDQDMSAETMSGDVVALWQQMYGGGGDDGQQRVPTVLVGHSMGGALAVHAAGTKAVRGLDGVVVVDVVEGTALAALPAMDAVLSHRPQRFSSHADAAAWALRSGTCKNRAAAAVSLPSQLVPDGERGGLRWRTHLPSSRPYWEGWYTGLSDKFLALPAPKLLLLAGTDRLDRPLTIGQMQGKFQLVVMPAAGHAIHEDEPEKTADHLRQFLMRFRVGQPPLVFPKAAAGVRPVLPVVAGPLHQP